MSPNKPSEQQPAESVCAPLTVSHPWEQQPRESLKAFGAFRAYLALGPNRSLAKAAASTGQKRDQLAHWSARWDWAARAAAHTAHLGQVEREASESLVRQKSVDWAKQHESIRQQAWKEGEDLIGMAQEFKERWRISERLPDFGAVIRALELAFKLKSFAAGLPMDVREVKNTFSGADGGPIRMEIEAALNKVYGPAAVPAEVIDVTPEVEDPSSPLPPPSSLPSEPSAPLPDASTPPPSLP